MNPLLGQGPPGGAPMPPQQARPEDIAKGHETADTMLEELMSLVQRPAGQLTKQDVFQGAASLLGKGLFNDPQSRAGLVAQLTQLPDDEGALRAALGQEILQIAGFKRRLEEHAAQGQPQAAPQGAPMMPQSAPMMPGGQ